MGQSPHTFAVARDALELVVGLQRVSAGGYELQHARKLLGIDCGIGPAGADFGEKLVLAKWRGAGAGHDMLGQHVEATGTKILAITLAFVHRLHCCSRLQKFKSIARHQQRAAGLVKPVIGAAYTLQQARRPLWCTHLHHHVDIAPVDTQIEAGGTYQSAQFAPRHRALHLTARLFRKRTVVDANRQVVLVRIPQVLEDIFRQETRVGKDQRSIILSNAFVKLGDGPGGGVSAPGHPLLVRQQNFHLGFRADLPLHQIHGIHIAPRRYPAAITFRIRHCRG